MSFTMMSQSVVAVGLEVATIRLEFSWLEVELTEEISKVTEEASTLADDLHSNHTRAALASYPFYTSGVRRTVLVFIFLPIIDECYTTVTWKIF